MVFLHIDTKNYEEKDENGKTKINKLNDIIHNNKNKVFILYYMEGCGPCNATRPEWDKLQNVLKNLKNNNTIAVVDVDQVLSGKIKKISPPNSFPTIRFIADGGRVVENYEDSDIKVKDRSIDSFVNWINSKINNNPVKHQNTRHNYTKHRGGTKKGKKGGKWTKKYKQSINCKKPKGFSQKQYCKYGRK
jgi:thiol-disulfide isomerase/thioredoxin